MFTLKYKGKALDFALEWGWDGILWNDSGDDFELYEPGFINDYSEAVPLTPQWDNVNRLIIATEDNVGWLDPEVGERWGDARGKHIPRNDLNGRAVPEGAYVQATR